MTVDIEFIMSTLWAQITPLIQVTTLAPTTAKPFAYGSRRLQLSSDAAPVNKPSIYLHQPKISPSRPSDHVPGAYTIKANIWIFTDAGLDPAAVPITTMNILLQNILNLFSSNNPQNTYNIPGTQARLRIDGDDIVTDAGDLDGNGLCLIPLKILIPNF